MGDDVLYLHTLLTITEGYRYIFLSLKDIGVDFDGFQSFNTTYKNREVSA